MPEPAPCASGPQRWLPNILLSVVVLALLLGALEGGSRLLERLRPAPKLAAYLWDWQERWEGDFYTVGPPGSGWPPWEDVSADGVRDRAHPVEKLAGIWRVAFLGDSVTMGAGLEPRHAYPQVLEALVESQDRGSEVFNFALWGWSTRQQRIAYERLARKYGPDLVVVGVCLNDIPELQNNLSRPPAWIATLHERFALVRRVVNAQGREIASVEELFEQPEPAKVRQGWQRFFAEVRSLAAEVRRDGAALALLVFPFRFQVEAGAPPPLAQRRIEAFCASEDLRCLDLLPALGALGPSAFIDYDHLAPAGARATAEAIVASGLLPERPSQRRMLAEALERRPSREAALAAAWLRDPATASAAAAVAGHLDALREPGPGVRAAAAWGLAQAGSPANRPAVPALFAALGDPSETVRFRAAQALSKAGLAAPGDVPRLVERLQSPDPYVRAFAAWTLGDLGPAAKEAVPALVAALEEEDAFQRGGAALALAKMGALAQQAVPALVEGLRSADHQRRRNAAKALGKIGPGAKGAVPQLVTALKDDDQRVRAQAARALGRVGPAAQQAIPALSAARQDPEPSVRREAEDALRRIRKSG